MLSKNQWKYPAWNRLPAGKGSKDDQGFISSTTPGLTGKGICGSFLGRCSVCPVNSMCFSPGEMNSRAVQHFWLESKGKEREPAVGAIRKEREAFPFFQLNPRVKEETGTSVCVLCSKGTFQLQETGASTSEGFSRHPHWDLFLKISGISEPKLLLHPHSFHPRPLEHQEEQGGDGAAAVVPMAAPFPEL